MTWTIDGKRVLVTGANSGIGLATATELARRGADVTITARDRAKGEAAVAAIERDTGRSTELGILDLASLDSVKSFSAHFADDHDRLDVLINNAGVMAGSRQETPDGFEWTLGVNHLGPFLLTNLLTPLLVASAPSRVITVSSEASRAARAGLDFDDLQMTKGYSPNKAYAASKLANVLFTVELDRRLAGDGVTARALHPGVIRTSFGKSAESSRWMGALMTMLGPFLKKPEEGAATSVLLATAPDEELARSLYWAEGDPKEPIPAAVDPRAAERLWSVSERLVGLA
jgi:NAD(P)-dependent dehydrogenase (short-subunit alcohol dehydrogenase family)